MLGDNLVFAQFSRHLPAFLGAARDTGITPCARQGQNDTGQGDPRSSKDLSLREMRGQPSCKRSGHASRNVAHAVRHGPCSIDREHAQDGSLPGDRIGHAALERRASPARSRGWRNHRRLPGHLFIAPRHPAPEAHGGFEHREATRDSFQGPQGLSAQTVRCQHTKVLRVRRIDDDARRIARNSRQEVSQALPPQRAAVGAWSRLDLGVRHGDRF